MGRSIKISSISEMNGKTGIISEHIASYNELNIADLITKFDKHIKDETLIARDFYDDNWKVVSRFKDSQRLIDFSKLDLESRKQLKAYTLLLLDEVTASTVGSYSNKIKDILLITDNLKLKDSRTIDNLKNIHISYVEYSSFCDYLHFIKANNEETRIYVETLKTQYPKNRIRDLPTFQSILEMENIIDRFIKNDIDTYPNFYSIALWWKLTMLIPVRPVEFLMLKVEDIYTDANGKYMININRSLKSDPDEKYDHHIELISEYPLRKDIYDLFISYIRLMGLSDEEYIFNAGMRRKIKDTREFLGVGTLNDILNDFYQSIIIDKYGYEVFEKNEKEVFRAREIEKITLGDTRHFAFINLMLSGFNPYHIAQMGGHRTLEAQMGYYSGITSFCTSKAYALSLGINDFDFRSQSLEDWRKNYFALQSADLTDAIRIEGGYCISKNFPFECYNHSCRYGKCKYFIIEDLDEVNNEIVKLEDSISQKTELLQLMLYDFSKGNKERKEITCSLNENIIALARLYSNKERLEKYL